MRTERQEDSIKRAMHGPITQCSNCGSLNVLGHLVTVPKELSACQYEERGDRSSEGDNAKAKTCQRHHG